MNANFEPGILSPSSQYLQSDGGSQQGSMGTPRPGTPRGSYFRLSPDGNLNPGTPGAASHEHHNSKFPNSPWSGSEPATPGYNRNSVVPNSPSLPPSLPATPGGGFYQKPVNGMGSTMPPSNGAVVPTGSPWTDRSVCTPGPMTPLTPATPIPNGDHGYGGNNGSPNFQLDPINTNNTKSLQQVPHHSPPHHSSTLAGLLQEGLDPLLPVPVMNHSVQNAAAPSALQPPTAPNQNDNAGSLDDLPTPTLPLLSDKEISLVVDNNPNLIAEFEDFFNKFIHSRRTEENNMNIRNQSQQQHQQQQQQQQIPLQQQHQPPQIQPQPQQQQQQPQPPPHQLVNPMSMGNNGHNPMMYNDGTLAHGGQPQMMMNNGHLMNGGGGMHNNMGNSLGPMRQTKFNHHPAAHPYMMQNNNRNMNNMMMAAGRVHPGHAMQYGQSPHQQLQNLQPHHQNMGNMNIMGPGRPPQAQFGLQGHNQGASTVYAHPPSGNNGGYAVQVRQQPQQMQPMQQQHMSHVHWQNAAQQQPQQQPTQQQAQQQMNNLNAPLGMMGTPNNGGVMSNNRGIPQQQQPNSYFQNPVNTVNVNGGVGEQGLPNGNSVLPSATYPFDLNGGGGVGTMNAMNPGTSAMPGAQVPVQTPMSVNMAGAPTPQPNNNNNPAIPIIDLDLDGPYDGSHITHTIWNKALEKANNRTNPVAEVGKVLFDEIFSDDEVIQCTLSGRGSTEKFNPNKVQFLKRAVAWLLTRPQRPWEFDGNTCDLTLTQEDESGTKGLDKKVFTEYRSRRRGDILKARNQSTS